MSEQCSDCRFFKASKAEREAGYCRRHPPVLEARGRMLCELPYGTWIAVRSADWCGEYEPKEVPAKLRMQMTPPKGASE